MFNNRLKTILFFSFFCSFFFTTLFSASLKPTGQAAQEVIPIIVIPDKPTGISDLDLYYSQLRKNKSRKIEQHRRYLLETTSIEHFSQEFIKRGFDVLRDTASIFEFLDDYYYTPAQQETILPQLYNAAGKNKSDQLKRLADFLKGQLMKAPDEQIEWFEGLILRCQKAKDNEMETLILSEMESRSFLSENYARGFHYSQRLVEILEDSRMNYPLKGKDYIRMGVNYYKFKDYDRALYFLNKGLSYGGDCNIRTNVRACLTAWSYLADYHHSKGELDSATYYNRTILLSPEGTIDYPIHSSMALCNLARIEMEKGNYDTATVMLQAGLPRIEEDYTAWDSSYGVYLSLGECMLTKGDMPAVMMYINKVRDGILDFPEITRLNRLKDLFALESKYYSRLGEYDKAAVSTDSVKLCTQRYEQLTGQHFILAGEKRMKEVEMLLKNEQIAKQENILFGTLIIMGVVIIGMLVIMTLYRKKHVAYKALVSKANEWVQENETTLTPDSQETEKDENQSATDEDKRIMVLVENEMILRHVYREAGLTAESLAEHLGIHRNQLSRAINKITGENFNHYINSLRIKDAVRLISVATHKDLYINELYERVGFTNRSTFYRIFKQFTGLSPIEFLKNNNKNTS